MAIVTRLACGIKLNFNGVPSMTTLLVVVNIVPFGAFCFGLWMLLKALSQERWTLPARNVFIFN